MTTIDKTKEVARVIKHLISATYQQLNGIRDYGILSYATPDTIVYIGSTGTVSYYPTIGGVIITETLYSHERAAYDTAVRCKQTMLSAMESHIGNQTMQFNFQEDFNDD